MEPIRQIAVVDVRLPVLKRPVTGAELLCALRQVAQENGSGGATVDRFKRFIADSTSVQIDPHETLLSQFREWMLTDGVGINEANEHVRTMRSLVNALPENQRNRLVLSPKSFQKASRLDSFSERTREAIITFARDGRRISKGRLRHELLSPGFRESVVQKTVRFLRLIGKNDLFDVDATDVEKFQKIYELEGHRNSSINILTDVRQLFLVLQAMGKTIVNPLADFREKVICKNSDYVDAAGIRSLQDMSNVDEKDFDDVRGRLIAFGFCYDFALRIGEIARLKVQDIEFDGALVALTLRTEVQKGSSKPSACMFNYFEETRRLLRTYLALRKRWPSATDALFLSLDGKPLTDEGCRNAVGDTCAKLGIRTRAGKDPMPHRIRHSFATLNVEPLGLALPPHIVSQRLRHTDMRLTMETYVAHNPELQRRNHLALLGRSQPDSESKSAVGESSSAGMACDVPEREAIVSALDLGITAAALRKHATQNGMLTVRRGAVFYSRAMLNDLRVRWMAKADAINVLGLSRSGYAFWVASTAARVLVLGKASFVDSQDVGMAMRTRRARLPRLAGTGRLTGRFDDFGRVRKKSVSQG